MSAPVQFTGERFLPECTGEIWAEHWHRYLFAARFVAGKNVLDAASGEGYGSAWLARHAASVTGLDLDVPTVEAAKLKYASPTLRFESGSVTKMPFADASFDCAVSFETLEHLGEQEAMLRELKRVLRPDGLLIISTPNRVEYSERREFRNEFHVRELDEDEFRALLLLQFPAQRWFGQKLLFNSAVWPLPSSTAAPLDWIAVDPSMQQMPVPMYFIALAAASAQAIPADSRITLLADPDEAMYREYEQTVVRTDRLERLTSHREALISERDRILLAREKDNRHLEHLAAARALIVAERDLQLAAFSARATTMEKLIAERERVIVQRDRDLESADQRIATLEALVAQRERVIVERDAQLAEFDERVQTTEQLIVERDAQLVAANARVAVAERLIALRESIIVERDRQLDDTNRRASALEALVGERERLVVERDAQLAAANAQRATVEAIVVERDAQLSAANERAYQMERMIVERDQAMLDQQAQIMQARNRIAALETSLQESQAEVGRRGGLRWWLALPYLRLRRLLGAGSPAMK